MAKRKKQQMSPNYICLIISLACILAIYLINRLIFIRPLLWLVAIIFIVAFFKQFFSISIREFIATVVVLLFVSVVVDGILVKVFKRIPAFTYNVVSNGKVNIYYSPGLRVWQCDKDKYNDLIIDEFYNKGYVCNAEDISTIDSNSFLNSVIENFDDYHNQFVKIKGKISKKNSQISIEMRPYTESEIKVNGYVEFSNNIVLKIFFEQPTQALDEYDIYDDITILGLVKNMDSANGSYTIYMDSARILSTIDLDDFEISLTTESKCSGEKTLLLTHNNKQIYTYCVLESFVSYGSTTNELADSISSGKIDITDLYKGYRNFETDDNKNKLYDMGSYKVLMCNEESSNDIIIGKNNMKISDVICDAKPEQQ